MKMYACKIILIDRLMRCWVSLNFSRNSNKNKNLAQYERLNYISWNRNKEAARLETHYIFHAKIA